MTLDQLLTSLGVALARDEAGNIASHLIPTPQPAGIYAVVTEQGESETGTGYGYQERTRLVLVMLYGASGNMSGKRQLDTLMAWFRRQASSVDRWPGLRVQRVELADATPIMFDAETNSHYAGQRLSVTFIQNTDPAPV
ncbi:hypothetical protein [Deinococcus marmoris]|uniref:hypothetical protein n=1 Tax=Deinococcus marmoris TaxID=249408 RepID=UPI000494E1AE|nr:hypothetical protein [Deinococcus marmoris]